MAPALDLRTHFRQSGAARVALWLGHASRAKLARTTPSARQWCLRVSMHHKNSNFLVDIVYATLIKVVNCHVSEVLRYPKMYIHEQTARKN